MKYTALAPCISFHPQKNGHLACTPMFKQPPVPGSEAYPLYKRFILFVLPGLVAGIVILLGTMAWSARQFITEEYLKIAQRQARAILKSVQREQPTLWEKLTHANIPQDEWERGATKIFADAIDQLASDRELPKIKLYDTTGRVLYSTTRSEIGDMEKASGLARALRTKNATAALTSLDTEIVYELYIYLPPDSTRDALVVELYEPETWLANLLSSSVLSLLLIPLLLLSLVLAFLIHLVRKAQQEIDHRTTQALDLQMRLEKFVSRRAANAALTAQSGLNAGRTVDVCLYFADVRSFTSYAEENSPMQVVGLLNTLIDIQVQAIHKFGGDVDKIIGDAVLAVFVGVSRSQRAIACAQEVLQSCSARPDIERYLGIGIHEGPVIVGSIGSPDRLDYTVIGDSVNVAARFSEIAKKGEIIADISTLASAGFSDKFSSPERVTLKGRASALQIKRWRGYLPADARE
ncbi:MAG: hypothetical protein CFE43_09030 [Burkholderiales bacterium PBB3]|nr:MAG: hypothetical protein CFE43_09030 [Burkholderiales bacterium PBB3]